MLPTSHNKVRTAFTLIEVLIVITIVAILAILAVTSYGAVRQQARLDITADRLVSMMKEQVGKAMNGSGLYAAPQSGIPSSVRSRCFGFIFNKNKPPLFQVLTIPYVAVSGDKAHFCDRTSTDLQTVPVDFLEDMEMKELKLDDKSVDEIEIFFKPPFGKIDRTTVLANASSFSVTLGLKNMTDVRNIVLDLTTGDVRRLYPKPS